MRILCVVGTRPNFIKMAALYREINRREGYEPFLVHTGQHYDENMSKVFFRDLGLPRPDKDLDVAGGSYVSQTCRIMEHMEGIIADFDPHVVVVVGDVNSTLAASMAVMQTKTPLAHVEAGLRSFDRDMPEEMNRVVVDHIADMLFVTEQSGIDNLHAENIPDERIFFVGNTMVDTLLANIEKARTLDIPPKLGIPEGPYALATLHRPANSDDRDALEDILSTLVEVSRDISLILPIHPRTKARIAEFGLDGLISSSPGFFLTEPLGYMEFMSVMAGADAVLTDSGGIQEETTILGVPCITMRNNTERPVTIECGTNTLAGTKGADILAAWRNLASGDRKESVAPPLWDGKAAARILDIFEEKFGL